MVYDATIGQVVLLAAGAVLVTAAAQDFLDYLIPNRLVLALVALYPIYALSTGGAGWIGDVLVGVAVLIVGITLFAFRFIGGGDAKFLAATALWAGPSLIFPFLVLTALAGGALAVAMLSYGRLAAIVPVLPRVFPQSVSPLGRQQMAYGVAIAIGGLFVISQRFLA